MAKSNPIQVPSRILTPEVIERLLDLLGAGWGVLRTLKESKIRPGIYFHHRSKCPAFKRAVDGIIDGRRRRECLRRMAEHLRQKEERKRLRRIQRGPLKPQPGRQARLMSWAIGKHLPLGYGFEVPVEFEREWCEKFNYSLAKWNEDKVRFPKLMEKAFRIISGRQDRYFSMVRLN